MQISLFQRYKAFVNSLSIGETYTTDDLYDNVGRYESETMWKRWTKQRMYRTSTYQSYLRRLGALHNVKRGTWKVLHHIPEWFYSKHMNYLLGYERNEWSLDYMLDQGFPRELAVRVHIPNNQRHNPFKNDPIAQVKQETIDVDLLKSLYASANTTDQKKMRAKYPELFNKYSACYHFGNSITIDAHSFKEGPLMIGRGLAPDGLEHKCLVVSVGYELVVEDHVDLGNKVIYFKKTI